MRVPPAPCSTMRISEVFYSIQGEGSWAGCPMVFLRFQGCSFRCAWCDSQYTWDFYQGEDMTLEQVMEQVEEYPSKMACITGGEPLAHLPDFKALAQALKARSYWIEVETSGGYRLPWEVPVDSWVMDIKCPASGMEHFNKYEELSRLRPQDQLKFVVADRQDFQFALEVLRKHTPASYVLFSPVYGQLDPAVLSEWVEVEAPRARLSLQIHKYIWDPKRRGV